MGLWRDSHRWIMGVHGVAPEVLKILYFGIFFTAEVPEGGKGPGGYPGGH